MIHVWYNDNNVFTNEWLRNLMRAGEILEGEIDGRSINDIDSGSIPRGARCAFFAGVGGWDLALRLAGWPRDLPVWSGSCPCQPFSGAGKRGGEDDPRHLWPVWFKLIADHRPSIIFGEQVASSLGRAWFDGVSADLESLGYACRAFDLCAAGINAPHIRQRLYWVAVHVSFGSIFRLEDSPGNGRRWRGNGDSSRDDGALQIEGRCASGGLGNASGNQEQRDTESAMNRQGREAGGSGWGPSGMGISDRTGSQSGRETSSPVGQGDTANPTGDRSIPRFTGSFWDDFRLVWCRDNKFRRIGTGVLPLVTRLPRSVGSFKPIFLALELLAKATEILTGAKRNRKGRLQGYGNAIVPPLAADFIGATMETLGIDPEPRDA